MSRLRSRILSTTLLAIALGAAPLLAPSARAAEGGGDAATSKTAADEQALGKLQLRIQKAGPAATAKDHAEVAAVAERLGRPAEAAAALAQAVAAGFKEPGTGRRLGRLYEAAGQFDKSVLAYKPALDGMEAPAGAELAQHIGDLLASQQLDAGWAAKEWIEGAKRFPGQPATRQALLNLWNVGGDKGEDVNRLRYQAEELLIRQFPGDVRLRGIQDDWFNRVRGSGKLYLEVWDILVQADPTAATAPPLGEDLVFAARLRGTPAAELVTIAQEAVKRGGNPQVLWETAHNTQDKPARVALFLAYADANPGHGQAVEAMQYALESGADAGALQPRLDKLEQVHQHNGDMLARLAMVRGYLAGADGAKAAEAWKKALAYTPWPVYQRIDDVAGRIPAVMDVLAQDYAAREKTDDLSGLPVGLALGSALSRAAGEDPARCAAAAAQFVRTYQRFGLANDDVGWWGLDRLGGELMPRGKGVDNALAQKTYADLLALTLSPRLRVRVGEWAADTFNRRGQPDTAAPLIALSKDFGKDPVTALLAQVNNAPDQGARARLLLERVRKPDGLSPTTLAALRNGVRAYAEQDGPMQQQLPEICREFYLATKDPGWAGNFLRFARERNRREMWDEAVGIAKELLAGPAKGDGTLQYHAGHILLAQEKPAEALALITASNPGDPAGWWSEVVAIAASGAARSGDKPTWDRLVRSLIARGEWGRVYGGALWEWREPQEWKWPLVEELITTCPDRGIRAECLRHKGEAQWRGDFKGFQASMKKLFDEFPDAGQREWFLLTDLQAALERQDAAGQDAALAALLAYAAGNGIRDTNAFAQFVRGAVEPRVKTADAATAARWYDALLTWGGANQHTTWAARRLYDQQYAADRVQAAITLHRLVRTGWRDDGAGFERVFAEVDQVAKAGDHGIAAGAFQNIARWFNPGAVGPQRIQQAQGAASSELAKLGLLLQIDDNDPRAPLLRAGALLAGGDEVEAYRQVADKLKLIEDNLAGAPADLVLLVARNLVREGRTDQARRLLGAFMRGLGDNAATADAASRGRFLLGEAAFADENHQLALSEYQSVIATWPKLPVAVEAALRIGDSYWAQRQMPQARTAYEQLAASDDRLVRIKARFRLALLANEEGQRDESFRMMRELAADNPPKELKSQMFLDWTKLLIDANRLKEAEDLLTQVGLATSREPIAPGEPLKITLTDSFLQTSQNRSTVPVIVRTRRADGSAGDQETVELVRSQDIKGLFVGAVPTALGNVAIGDRTLQIAGTDIISYDYAPEFKLGRQVPDLSGVEIRVAANGEVKAGSTAAQARFDGADDQTTGAEKALLTADPAEAKRQALLADSKSRTFRSRSQIKPGNPIHVAVRDGDLDVSDAPDRMTVRVEAAGGDQVVQELVETAAHSGIFAATVKTALRSADLRVSDRAAGSDPVVMLTPDGAPGFDRADQAWVGLGDRKPGKLVTLDLKTPTAMDRFTWSRGQSEKQKAEPKAAKPEWTAGLSGLFWEGRDFERGRLVHRTVGEPAHENFNLPGYGTDNYCDRWTGEVRIASDGTWVLAVEGDDGVRLLLDDKVVAEGWRDQGTTRYQGEVELKAGWHKLVVEHYQGGGGASLNVLLGKQGSDIKPVKKNILRTRPGMGSSGPAQTFGLDRRITEFRVECSSDGRWWTPLYDTLGGDRPVLSGRLAAVPRDGKRLTRGAREAAAVLSGIGERTTLAGETPLRGIAVPPPVSAADPADTGNETLLHGRILLPEAGTYAFAWRGTGRAWVMVGDQLVVEKGSDDADPSAGEPRWHGTIEDLPFGLVPLRILVSSDRAAAGGTLLWKRPGKTAFEPVPQVAVDGQAKAEELAAFTGRDLPTMSWADDRWGAEVKFPPITARFLRMVVNGWDDGDAPAIASVRLYNGQTTVLPAPGVDYRALAENDILELSPGDTVTVSHLDEHNKKGAPETVRARLDATYFNGVIDFVDARNEMVDGQLREQLYPRYRFKAGERITAQVTDYDGDVSDKPDTIEVVFRSSLGSLTVKATETGPATGLFQAEVRTARPPAAGAPALPANVLAVADGDQVWATYVDQENTIPGGPTKRTRAVRDAIGDDVRVAVAPSTAVRPPTGSAGLAEGDELRVTYQAAVADAGVALAPLRIEVTDAASMVSAASTVRVRLTTASGASLDLDLEPQSVEADLFAGTVPVVLGDKSTPTWRLPAPGEARSDNVRLVAVGEVPLGADPVLPVQGAERITITRLPGIGPKSAAEETAAVAAKPGLPQAAAHLATTPELLSLQPNGRDLVTSLYVGGELRLLVVDPDADATPGRDKLTVAVTSGLGDRLDLPLEESESHSGRFSAVLPLELAAKPVAGDEVVQVGFGDSVTATYQRAGAKMPVAMTLPVAKGDDARVGAFAKRFGDDALAAKTQVRLAECFFELYKSHREELKKLKEQKGKEAAIKRLQAVIADELAEGTTLLQRTIRDYGDSGERDQLLFLLGNFEQESEQNLDAIEQYTRLLAAYPDSASAPEAQYKIAQCYEAMQRYDEAWDHYVRLAYRWPQHARVGDAMVRIGVYYRNRAKKAFDLALKDWQQAHQAGEEMPVPKEAAADWLQAAAVYGKFVERFKDHELVDKVALTQGDCYLQARDFLKAIRTFDEVSKQYPAAAAKGLYWAGKACMEANQVRDGLVRFQQLLQNYPESTEAKYARGLMVSDPRLIDAVKAITTSQ